MLRGILTPGTIGLLLLTTSLLLIHGADAMASRDNTDALIWSTYLGGNDVDLVRDFARDSQGNLVVCGHTESPDFPTTPGAFDTVYESGNRQDGFVAKLDPTGSTLLWSTFLGAEYPDYITSLALDANDNVVVFGTTHSWQFPVTAGAYDEEFNEGNDTFVAKLSADGDQLLWATYLGGYGDDGGHDMAMDSSGDLYLVGTTNSGDFPVTPGAYDEDYNHGTYWDPDFFLAKLSGDGSSLEWASFLGGSLAEVRAGVEFSPDGHLILAGTVQASFPTTPGAYDETFNGDPNDVFVCKFASTGDALIWSTFLGGEVSDFALALAVWPTGEVTVAGHTGSGDYPVTPGAYDTTHGGNGKADVFVSTLSANGDALLWSTFLGGGWTDEGWVLARASDDRIAVAGITNSNDFPTTPGAYDSSYNGDSMYGDLFVSVLNPSGSSLEWSSYLGGSLQDGPNAGVMLDGMEVLVAGKSTSSDFPIMPGAYDEFANGLWDAVLFGLSLEEPTSVGLGVPDAPAVLLRSHPNPFNPSTELSFVLAEPAAVSLAIYDLDGRRLVRLLDAITYDAGRHTVSWDGHNDAGQTLPSGLYFCEVEAGEYRATRKMTLLK